MGEKMSSSFDFDISTYISLLLLPFPRNMYFKMWLATVSPSFCLFLISYADV